MAALRAVGAHVAPQLELVAVRKGRDLELEDVPLADLDVLPRVCSVSSLPEYIYQPNTKKTTLTTRPAGMCARPVLNVAGTSCSAGTFRL